MNNRRIANELVDMAERIAQEAKGLIGKNNDKDYKFYTVVKDKIEGGWEYKDDAKDNIDEMKEEGIRGKILSITGLERKGIDPNDDKNWTSGSRIAGKQWKNNRTAAYGFSKESKESFSRIEYRLHRITDQLSDLFDEVDKSLTDEYEASELSQISPESLDQIIRAQRKTAGKIEHDLEKKLDYLQHFLRSLQK